jgi:hypothetical protein
VMMNSLVSPFDSGTSDGVIDPRDSRTKEEQNDIENFIKKHSEKILANIHLANSPEAEIKEMLNEVLSSAGLIEDSKSSVKDIDSASAHEETDKTLENLMGSLETFKPILRMTMKFATSAPGFKYLSDYQFKFVLGLQYLGVADCLGQGFGADDITVMAAFAVKTADRGADPIFDWDHKQAGEMFAKMTSFQEEAWARKIIINGGESAMNIIKKDNEDLLPLLDIYNDEDLMKEVARSVIPD